MNKTIKWAGIVGIMLFFAAAATSCSSTRHLGCPMKITRVATQAQWPAC